MQLKKYSWAQYEDALASKKTDKSAFIYNGSGIPRDFYDFFKVTDLKPGERRDIHLELDGEIIAANILRVRHGSEVIQIYWESKLSKYLREKFKDFRTYEKEDFPELMFKRLSDTSYEISVMSDTFYFEDFDREDVFESYADGKETKSYVTKYERNPKNRENAIKAHGRSCMICGFNFEESYGDPGKGFIEVHHKKPVSEYEGELFIDPVQDLACLCSNCHRIIHRNRNKTLSVEELQEYYDKAQQKKQTSEKSNYNEPPFS